MLFTINNYIFIFISNFKHLFIYLFFSDDKTVKVWSRVKNRLFSSVGNNNNNNSNSNGNSVSAATATASRDSSSISSSISEFVFELSQTLQGHTSSVWSVAITADGNTIVSGSSKKRQINNK